jgi:hypothetical protein
MTEHPLLLLPRCAGLAAGARAAALPWRRLLWATVMLPCALAVSAQQPTAPPSATGPSAAFAFRDTADGISCKFFDVAMGLQWPEDAVPWVDAAGQAGGSKPYDAQLVDSRQTARVMRWNVLALVKAWASGSVDNEGLLLGPVGAAAGGGADFHSRETADVGLRPSLRVQHADGAI